jgi:hypothetical protein
LAGRTRASQVRSETSPDPATMTDTALVVEYKAEALMLEREI